MEPPGIPNSGGKDGSAPEQRALPIRSFLLTVAVVLFLNSLAVAYGFRMLERFQEEFRWTLLQTVPSRLAESPMGHGTQAVPMNEEPALVIELFSDFSCPVCRLSAVVVDSVRRSFPDRVRWEHRFIPRSPLVDPVGFESALVGVCLLRQDLFWEFYERLGTKRALTQETLRAAVEELGVSFESLQGCLRESSTAARVWSDIFDAARRGIEATPTLEINGIRIQGEFGAIPLLTLVESELAEMGLAGPDLPASLGG